MMIESPDKVPTTISLEAARVAGVIASEVRDLMDDVMAEARAGARTINPQMKRTQDLEESIAKLVQLAINREFRTPQAAVAAWVQLHFGDIQAKHPGYRAMRLVEETIELAQACGVAPETCLQLVHYVYSKLPGAPFKELGGVATTLLATAAACKIDLAEDFQAELCRIGTKSKEYWQARNATKEKLGFGAEAVGAIAAAQNDAPDGSAADRLAWLQALPDAPGCCGLAECTSTRPGCQAGFAVLTKEERAALLDIPADSLGGPETGVQELGATARDPYPTSKGYFIAAAPCPIAADLHEGLVHQVMQYPAPGNPDAPLSLAIKDNALVITIGLERLAFCFEESEENNDYSEEGAPVRHFSVEDQAQFAKDVISAMCDEAENGATPFTDFLDNMCQAAANDGSLGLACTPIAANQPNPAAQEAGAIAGNGHCAKCNSPAPHLHPAIQAEGEVQPCTDPFHRQITPENTPERIAETDNLLARLSGISIFKLNDCDWVAASSLQEAIDFYLGQVGTPADKATAETRAADLAEYVEEPHQVGAESMGRLIINCDDVLGAPGKRTFAEELARLIAEGQRFPVMFCSTEW